MFMNDDANSFLIQSETSAEREAPIDCEYWTDYLVP